MIVRTSHRSIAVGLVGYTTPRVGKEGALESTEDNTFLRTDRLLFRPVERADLPTISSWYNDPDIRRVSGMSLPFLEHEREEFYQHTQSAEHRIWFAVVTRDDKTLVAETGFQRFNPNWRTADLTLIVGDERYQGQGYGTEILKAMIEYGFGVVNLHRIAVGIVGFNDRAIAFYKKMGFVEEGRQRDGYYWDRTYHDFVMMSLLESEFDG